MSNIVTIYTNKSLIRKNPIDAWETLKKYGCFNLFLEFVDPRTSCLVQSNFTFYPKPISLHDYWLLAEHNGLALKVPSDMAWYAKHQGRKYPVIFQRAGCIVKGEYKNFDFNLTICPNIRVDDE